MVKWIAGVVLLTGCCTGSFFLGRESAKPSTSRAIARLADVGPFTELAAGLLEDAKHLFNAARLDVCLADSEKLEKANRDLAERLGTAEDRRDAAIQAARESQENLRKSHEAAKELSERLYSQECEEWASTPVCPALRGVLRSERDKSSRAD